MQVANDNTYGWVRPLAAIGVWLIGALTIYGAFSFIAWAVDAQTWGVVARIFFIAIQAFWCGVVIDAAREKTLGEE